MKTIFRAILGGALLFAGCTHSQAQPSASISGFDKPYLFGYGSWDKVAKIENGALSIQTPDAKGGVGDNFGPLDWTPQGSFSPQLRVRVGPNNTLKTLRLLLGDANGGSSSWDFSLQGVQANQDVTLSSVEGASLAQPSATGDKGALNLKGVMQWQVQGDWSEGAVDVALDAVELAAPDATVLAARAAKTERLNKETAQKQKEQLDARQKFVRGPMSPVASRVYGVSAQIIALEINSGRVINGSLAPYVKRDGDQTREVALKDEEKRAFVGAVKSVVLNRGGQDVGFLVGPKRDQLQLKQRFEGDPLLEFEADNATNYKLSSVDDANYRTAVSPEVAGRKTTPTRWALGSEGFEIRHTIYLRLPSALQSGKKYSLSLGALNTKQASFDFQFDPATVRSDAVHVQQIGFRPDDPSKIALVSSWLGTGGALKLPSSLRFSLRDDKSGKAVFSGVSTDVWPSDKIEKMGRDANFSATDVARLDFSGFQTAGKYRVVVEGVGSSFPFEIGPNVWQSAFLTQMKGLYNQRSGVELGPPYTPFKKPRDMFPGDPGVSITLSKFRFNGGQDTPASLAAGDTGVPYSKAWGGYHDAGDWNPRRITHMKVTLAQLEAFEMFPRSFAALKFGIPQDGPASKNTPDILREAVFEFETFHRMQEADGGVHSTIETDGDPVEGEVSWLQSMKLFVAAPDYLNNWFYAGVGARLSRLLAPYDAKLSATYRQSAVRAFEWAERDWASELRAGRDKGGEVWTALDARNLACVELLKTTGETKWRDLFLQNTVLTSEKPELFSWGKAVQRDAAFAYATLPAKLGDATMKQKAVLATEEMANRALAYARDNAWSLTSHDRGKPQFIGFYSMPDTHDLARAHFLTGKTQYLAGVVAAAGFAGGANPNNLVYTSGVGANPIRFPFKVDAEHTGQPVPVGLTAYGNVDLGKWSEPWIMWPITYFFSKNTTPHPQSWPTNEAYWDTDGWPALQEFTVDAWAPNVATWGYLAGRAPLK